jgi:D-alanyl-D-alanine dipeptidase
MIVRSCWRENGGVTPPLDLVKKRSMILVANYPYSGTHLMAAAVDISVFRIDDGSEVSRGKPYLEMSEYTPMDSPFVSAEEHQNRMDITAIMERQGFLHFPGEFWHYNKGDALYHITTRSCRRAPYGPIHWNPLTGEVTPYDDIQSPLTSPDLLAENLQQALKRMKLD